MITIIDYGLGNIRSFVNLYERLNIKTKVANSTDDIISATKIILPGVGAFDYAMSKLNKSGMREELEKRVLIDKVPVLGICVGMQILGDSSEEGTMKGLGWIKGANKKFKISEKSILPHMGWNNMYNLKKNKIFENINESSRFYFLHSYYFECENQENELARTFFEINYTSAINEDNIYGIQFHPEKSHSSGIQLLHNFSKI